MNISNSLILSRNISYQILTLIFGKAFGAIASIILIRYLGAELQGIYSYILTIVALFSFVSDFGLQSLLVREVKSSGENAGKVLGNAIVLQIVQVVISIIVVNLYGIIFEAEPEIRKSLILASVAFSLLYLVNPFLASMGSYEKMHLTGLSNSAASIFNALIIVIAVMLKMQLNGIIMMLAFSNILNLILTSFLCIKFTVKPVFKIEKETIMKLLKMSVPFAFIGLFNFVYSRIDVPLLYKMRLAEEVGYYTAVTKLIEILNALITAIMVPVYPRMAYIIFTEGKEISRIITLTVKYIVFAAAPCVMMVSISSSDYISIILGTEFNNSAIALSIMIWSIFLMSLHIIPTYALNAARQTKLITYVYGINILINLGLNLIFIPIYGYVATSVISVLCNVFVAASVIFLVKKKIGNFKIIRNLMRIAAGLTAQAVFMLWFKERMPFIPLNIISIFIFCVVVFVSGYFNSEDFKVVKNVFIRKPS